MIPRRSLPPTLAFLAIALAVAAASPLLAAPKDKPTPSASPVATAAPTATPLDVLIPQLEATLKANPNDKDTALMLAEAYLQANRPDLASPITQKLIAGGNKTAEVYYVDGAADMGLNKLPEATASLEQASNLDPTNMGVLQDLTTVYMRTNRPDDAERVAKRAVTFNKNNKQAYENYGYLLAALKRYDEARQQFETAANLDPKDPGPLILEARTYQEQNAIALAAQLYDKAVSVDPKNLEALLGKAQIAAEQHNVQAAVTTFQTILDMQTNDYDRAAVMDQIANVYANEQMDSDADTTYRRAIDAYPSVPEAHVVYGDYLNKKGDKAGAEREWNLGLGPNNDNPDALARVGELAMQNKDWNKAIDMFKRLTQVASGSAVAYLELGQAYVAAQNYTSAQTAFKQSFQIDRTPEALVGLATADEATKNYSEAVQIYEAIDKDAPELVKANPQLLLELARCYEGVNQPQKARDTYTRLLAILQPGSPDYNQVKLLMDGVHTTPGAKPAPKPSPTHAP